MKARGLLPAAAEIRAGDVTAPGSLSAARLGACCAIFFAVDVTGGVGGRGFFKPASEIRAVTYEGLVNVVDAAKAAAFTGRFVLVSGMGSELPSFTGRLLNAIKGDLQRNQRDRDAYLRNSGLDCRGGILTDEPGGRADIRITPPVHRLSLFRRVARADFARALIAAAAAVEQGRLAQDIGGEILAGTISEFVQHRTSSTEDSELSSSSPSDLQMGLGSPYVPATVSDTAIRR